jgi:thioredoxin-dependent peroxiredoxin
MTLNRFIGRIVAAGILLLSHPAMAQKLVVGQAAPDFEVMDTDGQKIRLSELKGQKVWLAFLRYAGCPVCNTRVHELVENHDSIRAKGYRIIAVFESANETLGDYLSESPAPFSVVGDDKRSLFRKYGVERSFWKTLRSAFSSQTKKASAEGNDRFAGKKPKRDGSLSGIPADFIIDENGIIRTAFYGTSISTHLPLSEVLTGIR